MILSRKKAWCAIPTVALAFLSGCGLVGQSCCSDGAAEPHQAVANPTGRGLLLNTGGIQLGEGVGKNAYRWQGDGEWGF